MPNQPRRQKVDHGLKQRWGMVGAILALLGFLWYANTMGSERNADKIDFNRNLVKITCPRCEGEKLNKCSLCHQHGYLWIDKTRDDLDAEIRSRVDEAVLKLEK